MRQQIQCSGSAYAPKGGGADLGKICSGTGESLCRVESLLNVSELNDPLGLDVLSIA